MHQNMHQPLFGTAGLSKQRGRSICILLIYLYVIWCPEGDLNPHDRLRSADFKSAVSADKVLIQKYLNRTI
jgi:hypothetical protein